MKYTAVKCEEGRYAPYSTILSNTGRREWYRVDDKDVESIHPSRDEGAVIAQMSDGTSVLIPWHRVIKIISAADTEEH